MNEENYHSLVGEAIGPLIDGLSPFVAAVFASKLPAGTPWTDVLRVKDVAAGHRGREYRPRDLSLLLRAMTERLGDLGYPFSGHLSRQAENYASELRTVRNHWAHNEIFTAPQAYRAIDSAELLLRAVGADDAATEVADLKSTLSLIKPTETVTPPPGPNDDARQQETTRPTDRPTQSARVTVAAVEDLSYAMAHCRIPVIDHITIDNTGDDVHGAVVEVDVVSARGSHGGPREVHVDLAANKPTVLRSVDLKLDPASMLAVDEQLAGSIRVVLRDSAGQVLADASKDVAILAANQWKATPPQLALELLAAYAQPNSAATASILTDVSDRLLKATGNSSIDGYQSEKPERVDAIAKAVFDAMRARDIRYAEPPASWGTDGQKIRTPAEVLDGRLGTCLDTTLTMASVLEQAGINSTIWVLTGHAFLGYWRRDSALGSVSTTEVVDVVNQVDLGNIGLIETTMTTQSSPYATFADATRAPRIKHLADDLSTIIGVTDIRQAREAHIYPLPSRAVDGAGNVVVTQYVPSVGRVILPYVTTRGGGRTPTGEVVPPRVAQWKNTLLDLSLRNKLINYTDRAGYRIDIPGPALGRFEDSVNAGQPLTLVPSDEVKNVDVARGIRFGRDLPEDDRALLLDDKRSAYVDITQAAYQSKLRYLANKARTIVEETGANNLYLGFGMLSWQFNDRELRSPLILVPVTLSTKNRGERYVVKMDEAGASTPNYCLIEKLRTALNLEIPELANPAEDDSGIDLEGTFNAVRRAIADAGLHFRVEDTVHLSILQFAKYPLWKDLDESWKELSRNSLVKHLVERPTEEFVDPLAHTAGADLDNLGTAVPVPADASQLHAVFEAVAGQTFVLEGPPGTGKSQTITNLLAHAIANGRRVLFVAEKRAALDVVKKRLEAVGLGELSLDLHDKSAKPSAVRTQIKDALELRVTYDKDSLKTQLQTAESSRKNLARYAERLHETNAVGQSLYAARSSELAADQTVQPIDVPKEFVAGASQETFEMVGALFRGLPEKTDVANPRRKHPWGFIDVPPANGLDENRIHAAATDFDASLVELDQSVISREQLGRAEAPAGIATWAALAQAPRHPLSMIDGFDSPDGRAQLLAIESLLSGIAGATHDWLTLITPAVLDLDVPAIHQAALAADESGFFGRKKRRRAVVAQLTDVLAVDPGAVDLKSLSGVLAHIGAVHAQTIELRSRILHLPIRGSAQNWNPFVADHVADVQNAIATLRELGQTLTTDRQKDRVVDLRNFYSSTAVGECADPLARLAAAWEQLSNLTGASAGQQRTWGGERSFVEQWWDTRAGRKLTTAASLRRWIDLIEHVDPLRRVGMGSTRWAILRGDVIADDAALAFDRGVAAASVGERLEASSLIDFDVTAHGKAIERFTSSSKKIRAERSRSIPAHVLSDRRFDAAAVSGQVGGLRRQLESKRGGMKVRQLMENFGELITQILPCTLMSPESVARFFPARSDLFDIVVFDEASQIRVADAVGAMGRAKSVVVVGDSKQMPPTSFAETSAAIDEDEDYNPDVVLDEESILTECVNARVPQQRLTWHYRSQDEALIAFSNVHYYQGNLASFPAPLSSVKDAPGHGVSLIRVNGHFERSGKGKSLRTNAVEAKAIVEDISRRFEASPGKAPSLGVITFNAPQRDLIENLLRDAGDDRLLQALDEPDGLFVKNLENVQGDERDTILFSVAFSKNDKNTLPLNFGPLSRPGGERRLNVAITRARCEVVLYSSFDPAELRAEETSQVGTKHLKAYLEMAAHGVESITSGGRRLPVIDRHRDDIAAALRAKGFDVATDVGLSEFRVDLVIANPDEPERPLVAVLLDGQEWRSRKTVADRDGLPVDVLANLMHWPAVERVWMPEWLNHRVETLDRLERSVKDAQESANRDEDEPDLSVRIPPPPPVETPPVKIGTLKSATTVQPPKPKQHKAVTTFREWAPTTRGDVSTLDQLPGQWARNVVRTVVESVIEAEGPIHRDRLARLVAGAFGLSRVSEDRRRAIQRVVPPDYSRADDKEFYWPAGAQPATWRTVRRPRAEHSRPLEEVSLVEIGNAMAVVAEGAGGISREELKREALVMLGGRRMTPAISARLDEAVKRALSAKLLREGGAGLFYPA